MDAMPRRVPVPGLAGSDAAAYAAIQNEPRLAVLRALMRVTSASRPEIETSTDLATTTTLNALQDLTELGYVVASQKSGRGARHIRYSVNRDALTTDLLGFLAWLLTDVPHDPS